MSNQANVPNGTQTGGKPSYNAIMVDRKVVEAVMAWLTASCPPVDTPCSPTEMIDTIVNQVGHAMATTPYYYIGRVDGSQLFKWCGTDTSHTVSGMDGLRDKGRWVAACLLLFQYGPTEAFFKQCRKSVKRYPKELTPDQKSMIETSLAARPDPEVGVFAQEPMQGPVEETQ